MATEKIGIYPVQRKRDRSWVLRWFGPDALLPAFLGPARFQNPIGLPPWSALRQTPMSPCSRPTSADLSDGPS